MTPVVSGNISEFYINSVATAERDGVTYREWVKPKNNGGAPMAEALKLAYALVKEWIEYEGNKDSFPPIIINITGGNPDDLDASGAAPESEAWANLLMKLRTTDGEALLFNLLQGEATGSAQVFFPEYGHDVPSEARLLFQNVQQGAY